MDNYFIFMAYGIVLLGLLISIFLTSNSIEIETPYSHKSKANLLNNIYFIFSKLNSAIQKDKVLFFSSLLVILFPLAPAFIHWGTFFLDWFNWLWIIGYNGEYFLNHFGSGSISSSSLCATWISHPINHLRTRQNLAQFNSPFPRAFLFLDFHLFNVTNAFFYYFKK